MALERGSGVGEGLSREGTSCSLSEELNFLTDVGIVFFPSPAAGGGF